ncbi:MAG: TonB-dependent receptor plug domain-containing protein, partial [Ignavibacteriales bacterium]|nr:TonB-dependent receptor plug domain-containing protein [Ignavibacteriales bacterium]
AGGKSAQLIVRGGSPDENLTLLDNIEIYNPIHFARTGESMGIISIINPSLLKSVDFMTGGFPASYGDKMSSVFDMSLMEGNKELHNVDINTNIGGFGALVDGPTPGGGSMVFSARRGFFDLLTSLMNRPAAPRYYDAVGKVTYDLDEKNRVSFLGFYYLDQIERAGTTPQSAQGSKYDYLTRDDFGSAAGINWRSLLSTDAYSLTTLSFSGNGWNTLQGTETNRSARGEDIREYSYSLKNEISYQLQPELQLKGGVQLHLIDSKHIAWTPEDTTRNGQLIPATSTDPGYVNFIFSPVEQKDFCISSGYMASVRAAFAYNRCTLRLFLFHTRGNVESPVFCTISLHRTNISECRLREILSDTRLVSDCTGSIE